MKERLASIANEIGFKSYIVKAESCELYLTVLALLVDLLVTQVIIQEPVVNSRGDDEICIIKVTKDAEPPVIKERSALQILRTVYGNFPSLESHILSIIDGKQLTDICKRNLAKMKLNIWHAIKVMDSQS